MTTLYLIAKSHWRTQWHSLIGLALLVGFFGGLVLAAGGAAARIDTAVERMEAQSRPYDVVVAQDVSRTWSPLAVEAQPQVARTSVITFARFLPTTGVPSLSALEAGPVVGSMSGGGVTDYLRPVLSEGRLPLADSTDEVVVDQLYADAHDIHPGDVLTGRTLSSADVFALFNGDGAATDTHIAELTADPDFGTTNQLSVVGVGTMPDAILVDQDQSRVELWGGPQLRAVSSSGPGFAWMVAVWLKDPNQLAAFEESLNSALSSPTAARYTAWKPYRDQLARALAPAAAAMWLFAGMAAVLGLLLAGQAISRRLQADVRPNWPLAALGVTHRQRMWAASMFVAPAALVGAGIAVGLAFALSWVPLVGLAQVVAPNRGPRLGAALPAAGVAVAVAFMLVAVLPAWTATRVGGQEPIPSRSAIAGRLAAWGAPVALSLGTRFALEPGPRRAAVPTRATIIGAVTGITCAVAALTFVASLGLATSEPRFYGVTFDGAVQYYYWGRDGRAPTAQALAARLGGDPAVTGVANLRTDTTVIDGRRVPTLAWGEHDAIKPVIAEGRAPRTRAEVALGQVTLEQLGLGIGDRADVRAGGYSGPALVVGRAVLPGVINHVGDGTAMGVGAIMADAALGPPDPLVTHLMFRVRPGANVDAVYRRAENDRPAAQMNVVRFVLRQPADVRGLRQVSVLPLALAATLILVVVATVAHALVLVVRRRRRELAVLHTLGAKRAALGRVGLVQGVTLIVVASLVGIPAGIVIGRWTWIWLAQTYGTLVLPVVPIQQICVFSVALVLLAALAGMISVRWGLRGHLVGALRDE